MPTAVLAWLCLLAIQVSGLHLHVDMGTEHAEPHETQMHQFSSPEAHHDGEVDVQLLEQFVGQWSKIIALVCYVFVLLVAARILRPTWSPPLSSGKINRRLRWRPLLRAPPLSL